MDGNAGVQSHWNTLIENLETSSLSFYEKVEAAVAERRLPEVSTERVTHKEGGIASANRTYLRVKRGKLSFDICGAQYGTGHFFSWWLIEQPPKHAVLIGCVLLLVLSVVLVRIVFSSGIITGLLLFAGGTATITFLARHLVGESTGFEIFDDTVLAMPLIGPVYGHLFRPVTYYSIDTRMMFQQSIHRAITSVINGLTEEHGLRCLSPDELRPVERNLLR